MNEHDFYGELQDTGHLAEQTLLVDLLGRIPLLIDAQVDKEGLDEKIKYLSALFKDLMKSKPQSKNIILKHKITLLEKSIEVDKASRDRYYQLKRAEAEITKVHNRELKKISFTKASTLKSESVAIFAMRKSLKVKDICSYLNNRYTSELKEFKYADFSEKDVVTFIKKTSDKA